MSLLPLVSKESEVWKTYWGRTRGLLQVGGTLRQRQGGTVAKLQFESGVTAIAYSPDGTRFALGSREGTIRICDAYSGTQLADPFKGHTDHISGISFSPDGRWIVSISWDKTVCIWNAHDGLLLAGPFILDKNSGLVSSVAFMPDGMQILSVCNDCTVFARVHDSFRIRGVQGGGPITRLVECYIPDIDSAAFSPDRSLIATSCHDYTIRVWAVCNGILLVGPLKGHTAQVNSVAFSHDGTRIASGSDDRSIRVWSTYDGSLLAGPFEMEHLKSVGPVARVAFSPSSTCIVSASSRTIRVWGTRNGVLLAEPFVDHTKPVEAITFSPDGTRIAFGSLDGTLHLLDSHEGNLFDNTLKGRMNNFSAITFSADGTRIIACSPDSTLQVWDTKNGTPLAGPFNIEAPYLCHPIECVALSPNGKCVATGSYRIIWVQCAYNGTLLAGPFESPFVCIKSVAFSPDGARLVSSCGSTVLVWDVYGNNPLACVHMVHSDPVNSAQFSPDGTLIVSSSNDGTIQIWDAHTGIPIAATSKGDSGAVTSVAFSPDSSCIVCSAKSMIWVVDASDATVLASIGPFQANDSISQVAFSPDGTCIVSVSQNHIITVWNARKNTVNTLQIQPARRTCPADVLHISPQNTDSLVAISPGSDGARIAFSPVFRNNGEPYLALHEVSYDAQPQKPFDGWTTHTNGWVMDRASQALLWLPTDLHISFPQPPGALMVCPEGSISVHWTNLLLGESWNQCYDLPRGGSSRPS